MRGKYTNVFMQVGNIVLVRELRQSFVVLFREFETRMSSNL